MNVSRQAFKPVIQAHPLLSSLTPDDVAALGARAVEHRRGTRLLEAGKPLRTVHFVHDGLVGVLGHAADGATAEVGLVGPGGMLGFMALLEATHSASDAVALIGTRSFSVDVAALNAVIERSPALRRALTAYAASRLAQTTQLCVCAALHSVEQRLARWLLVAGRLRHDRPVEITHQQLAELLGVRRASVTASLHLLEGEQAVRCRRGRIDIRDVARLESRSCGCHRMSLDPLKRKRAEKPAR